MRFEPSASVYWGRTGPLSCSGGHRQLPPLSGCQETGEALPLRPGLLGLMGWWWMGCRGKSPSTVAEPGARTGPVGARGVPRCPTHSPCQVPSRSGQRPWGLKVPSRLLGAAALWPREWLNGVPSQGCGPGLTRVTSRGRCVGNGNNFRASLGGDCNPGTAA